MAGGKRDKADARFREAVLAASESDTWEEARHEWSVGSCLDTEFVEPCVCGWRAHRLWCTLVNDRTGAELSPVGLSCVELLEDERASLDAKCWQQAYRLLDEAVRLGRDGEVPLRGSFFTRDLIAFLDRRGAFTSRAGNGFDEHADAGLLLAAFNARDPEPWLASYGQGVVREAVYPWLRQLWRANHVAVVADVVDDHMEVDVPA